MAETLKPIPTAALRRHFADAYKLKPEQTEIMVNSACKSVVHALSKGEQALAVEDHDELADFAHSLKGVLLNMGQWEWADVARGFEIAAREKKSVEYQALMEQLRGGMSDLVLFHQSEEDKR